MQCGCGPVSTDRPTDPPLSVPRVLASRRVAVRRRSQRASAPHLLPPRTQTTAIEGVVGATRLLGVESCTDMQVEPGVHDTAPPPLLCWDCSAAAAGGVALSPPFSPPRFLKYCFFISSSCLRCVLFTLCTPGGT